MNNDLISRSVLKDIWELYQKYQPKLATNVYEFGEALKGIIDNAPTVESERPHIIDNCDMNVFEPEKYMEGGADMRGKGHGD